MKVVVTGSSGFLGSYVTQELTTSGMNVIALSHGGEGWNNLDLQAFYKRARIALKQSDALVHLAGIAHARGISKEQYNQNIVQLTAGLLDAAVAENCPRFIYASSVKVYGSGNSTKFPVINEETPANPDSDYGKAKLMSEDLVLAAASRAHNMSASILRLPPLYGRGTRGAIRHLITAAKLKVPLPIMKSKVQRSILYAGNAAALIRELCEGTRDTGLLLPTDGCCWTLQELTAAIWTIVNGAPPSNMALAFSQLSGALLAPLTHRLSILRDFCCASTKVLPWPQGNHEISAGFLARGIEEHLGFAPLALESRTKPGRMGPA